MTPARETKVELPKSDRTCEQLKNRYEATVIAQARFADLKGNCEGVYEIDGALYVQSGAVIRRVIGRSVTLYLPATDHTFDVTPDPNGTVALFAGGIFGRREYRKNPLLRQGFSLG